MKWDNAPVYRRRRRLVAALAVLLSLVVFSLVAAVREALTSEDATSAKPAPLATGAPAAPGNAEAAAAPTTEAPRQPRTGTAPEVTLAFAGDTNAHGRAARVLDVGLGDTGTMLARADLAMVNLETVVAADRTGLVPQPKRFTFATGPRILDVLQDAGVDVVTAANNHGMDFGAPGMERMLQAKATSPVPIVGIGKDDAEAWAPWTTEVKGRTVSVFGATDVLESNLDWKAAPGTPGVAKVADEDGFNRLLNGVRQARAAGPDDVVVVYLHSGSELVRCPTPRQRDTFQRLAAAGADVVVGSHAHITQTTASQDNTAFAYGLGNFVFAAVSAGTTSTGVLTVTVPGTDGAPAMAWDPARITNGVPVLLSGSERDQALAEWGSRGQNCS